MDDSDYLSEQTLIGSERAQLLAFVHDNRRELVAVFDGLTEEQVRRRLVPSATTLLGILKHATTVEKVWFHVSLAGIPRAELGVPEDADAGWAFDDDDTVASAVAAYRATCAEADEIAARHDLDDLATHNRRGPLTLRWIDVHLIEELARHTGHADILREQVLAAG